jgi:hypothetical protein
MAKEIPLSQGMVALVSEEDYERASAFKWSASRESRAKKWYAIRWSTVQEQLDNGWSRRVKIRLHRFIVGLPPGLFDPEARVVDHVSGDSLDNQRENLRICSQEENMANVGCQRARRFGKREEPSL